MLPECAGINPASPFRLLELEKLIDDMQAVLRRMRNRVLTKAEGSH
jgi:hypothetical protein